jgi:hypothetical protein
MLAPEGAAALATQQRAAPRGAAAVQARSTPHAARDREGWLWGARHEARSALRMRLCLIGGGKKLLLGNLGCMKY